MARPPVTSSAAASIAPDVCLKIRFMCITLSCSTAV
jgi:hypothetical protein